MACRSAVSSVARELSRTVGDSHGMENVAVTSTQIPARPDDVSPRKSVAGSAGGRGGDLESPFSPPPPPHRTPDASSYARTSPRLSSAPSFGYEAPASSGVDRHRQEPRVGVDKHVRIEEAIADSKDRDVALKKQGAVERELLERDLQEKVRGGRSVAY